MSNASATAPTRLVQFFHVRILLRMTKPTWLHAQHAPALYALVAAAYGSARNVPSVMPDGVLLDAPEQLRIHLAKDDRYAFGLTLLANSPVEAAERLDQILDGLRQIGRHAPARGLALGGNFTVVAVEDRVADAPRGARQPLHPVPLDLVAAEVDQLARAPQLTLRFTSPLRCQRSRRSRDAGHGHFDRQFFEPRAFLERLVVRLRTLGVLNDEFQLEDGCPRVVDNQLVWIDASYGPREQRKALGGAVGRVVLAGCGPRAVEALVWGQQVRVGGQTRFGFGAYRIQELGSPPFACGRAKTLLELAEASTTLDQAAADLEIESGGLRQTLADVRAGSYRPHPHCRLEIVSGGGKKRVLAIPSRRDRALQRMVLGQIAPGLDRFLEDSSLAYRKGLGRQRAAIRIRDAYRRGFRWAVKADFASFFDNVDHRELAARVDAYLADDELAGLVMQWIRAGSPEPDRGLPTGAPLSPLLANLLLDQFDEQVASEGGFLVRYADDCAPGNVCMR